LRQAYPELFRYTKFSLRDEVLIRGEDCNIPAFRTKRRVVIGLLCIHAFKKNLSKIFANSKTWESKTPF
jgi:hypothetical protein